MNKAVTHSFRGMNQDIRKSSFPNEFYFEGKNIRIIATDSQTTGAVTNEKGNKLIYAVPVPVIDYGIKTISYDGKTLDYTTDEIAQMAFQTTSQPGLQYIIGHTTTRRYIVLFTSDEAGFDCIWRIDLESANYDIELLYLRNMLFNRLNPIQALNNFENKVIDKVYWIDGIHQMRFINIEHSIDNEDLENLIDVSLSTIDMVGQFDVSQPVIVGVLSGGIHTAGMIQYAYNLYRLNSSQTRLSPLSQLVALDKDSLGGGALNEVVGSTPVININIIDEDYTHIKVYAIKYTSFNEAPTISIIEDREISSSRSLEVFDDGSVITAISLEEFLFLGSDILIPKHINSKDNRLFLANYEERNYNVELDVRAFGFNSTQEATYYNDIELDVDLETLIGTPTTIHAGEYPDDPEDKNDSINLYYDIFKFQEDGVTPGGEGKYLKYELHQSEEFNADARYFKDEEIYRLGIEFVNSFGQYSLPRWIGDFKALEGNLRGQFNDLIVTLKPDFFTWLNTSTNFQTEYDIPVGYRVLIAERNVNDRTIVANGLISPMMINDKSTRDVRYDRPADISYVKEKADEIPKLPNMILRNAGPITDGFDREFGSNTRPLELSKNLQQMCVQRESPDTEFPRAHSGNDDTFGRFYQYNAMYQLYSPELTFNQSVQLSQGYEFRIKGGLINEYNSIWGKTFAENGTVSHEGKGYNGVSLTFADTKNSITSDGENPTSNGIICHPLGSPAQTVAFTSFYRGYGDVNITDTFLSARDIVSFPIPFTVNAGTMPVTVEQNGQYPWDAIRFASNNRDIIFTTLDDFRRIELSYVITPQAGFETVEYTASICADSEGSNVLSTVTVTGNGIASFNINRPEFANAYKEYHHYLNIKATDNLIVRIDIFAQIMEIDGSPVQVGVVSANNIIDVSPQGTTSTINFFKPPTNQLTYGIYGAPEITVRGQNVANYNKDTNYKYINTFLDIRGDKDSSWKDDGKFGRAIISGNSDVTRCITFVLDKPGEEDNSNLPYFDRPLLETLFTDAAFADNVTNLGLIGEIVKPRTQIYLGNIYGGNTWEDKKRTKYIEIGDFKRFDALIPANFIASPGDTFVNFFKFQRVIPKTPTVFQQGVPTWQEIVEFYTESTVDMKNRNDLSFDAWDSKFHYTEAEYQQYNRVYSQQSDLVTQRDLDFNVKKIDSFDTNIISTKQKSAGEIIDSWTDLLQNEVLTLDGKFGAINSLPSFNDELYAIQDKAFAFLSINPRVQVQGNDGLAIELGTGQVLSDYKYISTDSGTLNKWGVVVATQGIYFYDALSNSFNAFRGNITGLSDLKGMHTFLVNNVSLNDVKIDNPLIKKGIASGYDYINNDVLFTFHQDNSPDFTFSFNELVDTFVSFYDYLPTMYISKGLFLIAVDPTDTKLYSQYDGKYNEFFDVKYKSSITFNVNPDAMLDCVFDNINFKSEVYDMIDGKDVVDKTLTHIRAYNDYQDSGVNPIPLVVGRNNNLRRKFRDWNALIPREGRNRIRAPWIKLQLDFDNTTNNKDYKFVLHPVNIFYTI